MDKIRILLTGATGNMGAEALKLLNREKETFHITILSLPTAIDKKRLKKYKNNKNITIIWGDLRHYPDVQKAIEKVDIVIHIGALVSPLADHFPEKTWQVNFGGTKNIVDALLARQDHQKVKLVYIGSIAETGNRPVPYHWGRIGDPILPSIYDYYALSKIAAERYIIESGLKHWVSLRQTGILHDNIFAINDGIGYHQPLNNHLEWVTAHDSGNLILKICQIELPQHFWRKAYNIGGGKNFRLNAYQFTKKIYALLGLTLEEIEEPNWYALRNFHGHYYFDSDVLENYLHFRTDNLDETLNRIKNNIALKNKIAKYLPTKLIKKSVYQAALKNDTPLKWIATNNENKIKAFLGSKQEWQSIADWNKQNFVETTKAKKLNHGYNEKLENNKLDLNNMKQAAEFRGGKCLSNHMKAGDIYTKLKWQCAFSHQFTATPYLILKAGHWCPQCMHTPWNYDQQAALNPFIAQLWYIDHPQNQQNSFESPYKCYNTGKENKA